MVKLNKKELALQKLADTLDTTLFSALAEPVRIELLKLLILNQRMDVGSIAEQMPQDRSVISRHLNQMCTAGLLTRQKIQRSVYYQLDAQNCLSRFEAILKQMQKTIQVCCPTD